MMNYKSSGSFESYRRLTRDWHNIISENVEKPRARLSARRTFMDEIWFGSNSIDFNRLGFSEVNFVTGSRYGGQCNRLGMDGLGTYTFPHGVLYEGQFKDGMFHGRGILVYPQGQALNCLYDNGILIESEFILSPPSAEDGSTVYTNKLVSPKSEDIMKMKYDFNMTMSTYCKPPDRCFYKCYSKGLKPAPKENLTNMQPTKQLPEGCYDTVDGYYNPKTKWVHSFENPKEILYMIPARDQILPLATDAERRDFMEKIPDVPIYRPENWILTRCRKSCDENAGYKPEFYEYWFSGKEKDRQLLDMKTVKDGGKFHVDETKCEKALKILCKSSKC